MSLSTETAAGPRLVMVKLELESEGEVMWKVGLEEATPEEEVMEEVVSLLEMQLEKVLELESPVLKAEVTTLD